MWMFESKAAAVAFLATLTILLANAGFSHWNTLRLVGNERWVTHSHEVIETFKEVQVAVANAETAQRAYLITGDKRYLETYQAAVDRVQPQFARLKTLTVDNPQQQAHVANLDVLVQTRLERLHRIASLRQAEGFEAAQQVVGTDEGQLLMERIHDVVEAFQAAENRLLSVRAAESAHSLRVKIATNAVGTLFGVAAVCVAFLLFQRTLSERRKAEQRAQTEARRQAAIAELRQQALSNDAVDVLLNKASRLIAETLDVPLVKVLELLPNEQGFRLRAGVGWTEGIVGKATISASTDTQAGFTLHGSVPVVTDDLTTHEPVIVEDLQRETRFSGPALLVQHDVVSGMSVIIYDQPNRPFGVLGAHTTRHRRFTDKDARFLQATANVLGSAIQRRRAEDALRKSEQHFRALADSVPEIVWTSLPDGRCDYVNRRWFDFTGMTPDETLDFGWVAAVHEDDSQRSTDRWKRSMETGEPFECEYRFRTKDGTYRWCLGRALPLRDEHGSVVKWFGNCMDIDEHRRLEEALVNADRRKDQFLAMLGHELRNPLTPIYSAVEMLRLKSPDDSEIQWAADTIVQQTDQIIRLVDDLLDVSRIVHGKIRLELGPVDLRTIVGRAAETCQPSIEVKRQQLTVSIPDEAIWLQADMTRVLQVVENLVTNAVKYTEEGGRIWLTAACDGDYAVVRVRDSGIGIAPDMLPQVFDLFAQAEHPLVQSQGGLGLGLRLVASLVEMHGGKVEAFSDGPGKGSEFVVRLPAGTPVCAKPRTPQSPAAAARVPAYQRVLVVDDEAGISDSIARVLRRKGHEVQTASNAEEAMAKAKTFRPSVVLTDIGLPGIDGFELAGRLRQQSATTHATLIALTGFADEDVRNRACEVGFDHLLVKPPVIAELDALLESAGKSSLAGAVSEESERTVVEHGGEPQITSRRNLVHPCEGAGDDRGGAPA